MTGQHETPTPDQPPPIAVLQAWLDKHVDPPVPAWQTSWLHRTLLERSKRRR